MGTPAPVSSLVPLITIVASSSLLLAPSCLIPILIVVIAASSLVPLSLIALALSLALLLLLRLQEHCVENVLDALEVIGGAL